MQISYLIPSLYSLRREGHSNNSTSRQLHKSLKNPGKSNAISGMPRIMQRLIIHSGFGNRHRHCLLPYPLVTDIPGNSHCDLFLLLPPKNSHGFSTYFGGFCCQQHTITWQEPNSLSALQPHSPKPGTAHTSTPSSCALAAISSPQMNPLSPPNTDWHVSSLQ